MKLSDHQVDVIAETMREVLEATENNMITRANELLAKQSVMSIPRIRSELGRIALSGVEIQENILSRAENLTGANLDGLKRELSNASALLINSTVDYLNAARKNIISMERIMPLKEAIYKQTQRGFENGLKIAVSPRRQYGYKEYMEMSVRTTVQREIGSLQMASGKQAGVVFYISNHFADCADDHKAYQGRIYYDARYKSMGYSEDDVDDIERIISVKDMLSVQEVRDGKPYLTTRPNCRHTLTPISIEQARGSARTLVDSLKLSTGSYRDDNYDALQRQRYNERQIRFYKARYEHNKQLGDVIPPEVLARDRVLVSKWQRVQREHIDKYDDVLSRDYRRETREILVNDLGERYNRPRG